MGKFNPFVEQPQFKRVIGQVETIVQNSDLTDREKAIEAVKAMTFELWEMNWEIWSNANNYLLEEGYVRGEEASGD